MAAEGPGAARTCIAGLRHYLRCMAGIYIHIPFCKVACHYCDFHFSTSSAGMDSVLKAIHSEIHLRSSYLTGTEVNTVYFGGGTPSVVGTDAIARLLDDVRSRFTLAHPEITLEANPDDIRPAVVRQWLTAGVNRVSIGIQSFYEPDLRWLNRSHSAAQADAAVKICQDTGIENITIDLIYGIPASPEGQWEQNIQTALGLEVPHISAYCLTIEEKTVFGHRRRRGELRPQPDDQSAAQFMMLVERLAAEGLRCYEVSNFARPGFESRHNSAYWSGQPYLGLGPSAHSYNGESRQWNVSNNHVYAREISAGKVPFTLERLEGYTPYNEYVMMRLRTREGIRPAEITARWGIAFEEEFSRELEDLRACGDLEATEDVYKLTVSGLLKADRIAAGFFKLTA
jgi:oxygen-independent coproporphyrinogen-3 oxidase